MEKIVSTPMRIAFLGRGKLGMNVLTGLLKEPYIEITVIINCESSPELNFPEDEFEKVANKENIIFYKTNNINQLKFKNLLCSLKIDLAVAMLWLHVIDADIIKTSRLGFLNCHSGLLPKYRGNACGNWAIINGENTFGITCHFMSPGELDNGDIINQIQIPITPSTTIHELVSTFHTKGAELVLSAIKAIKKETVQKYSQCQLKASYCYPRIESDGEIDWNQSALNISTLIRAAGKPYPGAYSWFKDVKDNHRTKKLIIHSVEIIQHDLNEFHAVPGHLIRQKSGEYAVVCGDKNLLLLHKIEISGKSGKSSDFFNTVRQRLNLDQNSFLADLEARIQDLEQAQYQINLMSRNFLRKGFREVENYEQTINSILNKVLLKLNSTYNLTKNPLRNYSFQKQFYHWENIHRWFGLQIYRSIRLTDLAGEPIAFGVWYFSEKDIELRVFLSVKSKYKRTYSAILSELFEETSRNREVIFFPQKSNALESAYIKAENPKDAISLLIKMITKFHQLVDI